jgi:hypothetical protein
MLKLAKLDKVDSTRTLKYDAEHKDAKRRK